MQGMTCFNFNKPLEKAQLKELAELTKDSLKRFTSPKMLAMLGTR